MERHVAKCATYNSPMVTEIYASGVVSNIIFKKVAQDFNPMGGAKHIKLDYVDSIKILISLICFVLMLLGPLTHMESW